MERAPRILVVDDEPAVLFQCRRALKGVAEVEEAADPQTALALLATTRYDCVLSDYRLHASLDGLDVLERAAEAQPGALRILMSGFAEEAVAEAARARARVHDFFEKPMVSTEFAKILHDRVVDRLSGRP